MHWRWYCKTQGISFICWTSDRSSRRQVWRRTMKCRHGKKTLSPILIAFLSWRVLSQSLSRASKRMNSPKPQVRTTSKRMQHNVELFLSSELGHSPKRSVKLLGRKQRSGFHHNQTTPLSEGMWVFFRSVSFSLASEKFWYMLEASFRYAWQCAKSFRNYVRVSS